MPEPSSEISVKEIRFFSESFLLHGVLHLPSAERPPLVIGSHGLLSSGRSPKQVALARACNAAGIAYFRFDHRGCGRSQGVFQEVTSLDARCVDLGCAIKTIQSRPDIGGQLGLFGSSMGGAVCLSAASQFVVDALVTYAAPVRSSSVIQALKRGNHAAALKLPLEEKYFRTDISGRLANLHHILIIHGDADQVVPVSNAREIFSKAADPKKLIIQRGGDHRMKNKAHQQAFLEEAVQWFGSCFKQ